VNVAQLIPILIILLLVAAVVALLSRYLRIPYVTGLVLAGLAITELLPKQIGLDDSLILNLFLPILLFEAAINTDIRRLRSTIEPIALLAGPGVVIAAGIIAALLKFGLGLTWLSAFLIGAILANTDTVSVIAVFNDIPVPSRLSTIVEGESLFNDGLTLVLFSLILNVNATGSFSVLDGLQQIFVVIAGSLLVGLALGYLSTGSTGLLARLDDSLTSILLTVAVALGTFQIGQLLGLSGGVAVVIAGLVVGTIGLSNNLSASNKLTLLSFWEIASFIVNSFIFLLIGIEIDLITLWQTLPAVLLTIFACQIGRIVSVYSLLALIRWFDRPIPLRWQHVLFFGNIKGSLSMALALSIPPSLEARGQLISIVFGTVLLSLIGQGLSLPWLVKRLQLSSLSLPRQQTEQLQAQLMSAKAAQDELESLLKSGVLPKTLYEEMRSAYQIQVAGAEKALREIYNRRQNESDANNDNAFSGFSQRAQLDAIRRRLLLAEKGALNEAVRKQILSEEIVKDRMQKIDEQLLRLEDD
jgi:CPA1 family monovalent cation:H+ antiporter